MSDFKPFANDSQSMTFTTDTDEMSLENGNEAILLYGTLTIKKSDPDVRANVQELRDALSMILETL